MNIFPGSISDNEIGLTYDVFNDFRENLSISSTGGADLNLALIQPPLPFPPLPIPNSLPKFSRNQTLLRTASTTKVIHRSAIMTKKVARDLGSSVSTEYLAWDANTGQSLLTETINEYDDHYYNFTYPVHWYYDGMDMASINQGATGVLTKSEDRFHYSYLGDTEESIFRVGDELLTYPTENSSQTTVQRMWIADLRASQIQLMDADGHLIAYDCAADELVFQIIRSGYRNQQTGSMASVTTQLNPLEINEDENIGDRFTFNPRNIRPGESLSEEALNTRIVNASAVAYHEGWPLQWESNLPFFPEGLVEPLKALSYETPEGSNTIGPELYGFNPYLYNVRGEWRTKSSYAFLSGRNRGDINQGASPRYQGYFSKFNPFYFWNGTRWSLDTTNWTFASKVTKYSPYGVELENRDALGRFSAAQYGYNYTLPTAVASNSAYEQIGFDGFEDYSYQTESRQENDDQHFGFVTTSNAYRTESTAHTGRYSLKVTQPISLIRDYTNQPFNASFDPMSCAECVSHPQLITLDTSVGESDLILYSFELPDVTIRDGDITVIKTSDNCNENIQIETIVMDLGNESGVKVLINGLLQDCEEELDFDLDLEQDHGEDLSPPDPPYVDLHVEYTTHAFAGQISLIPVSSTCEFDIKIKRKFIR